MGIGSDYGPANAMRKKELWRELAGVTSTFQRLLLLIEGDFNVTFETIDIPNDLGGRDPDLNEIWAFISEVTLLEIGPMDCVYMWRSTRGRNMVSD